MKGIVTIGLIILCQVIMAQSLERVVVGATGDNFTNANTKLDWTVGELSVSTFSNNDVLLTQGFHQSDDLVSKVEEIYHDFEVQIFPNPFRETLNISFETAYPDLNIRIFDITGRLVFEKELPNTEITHRFNLSDLVQGNYIIKLMAPKNATLNAYKLTKLN